MKITAKHRAVFELLADNPDLASKEIAEQTSLNVDEVASLIDELKANGHLPLANPKQNYPRHFW